MAKLNLSIAGALLLMHAVNGMRVTDKMVDKEILLQAESQELDQDKWFFKKFEPFAWEEAQGSKPAQENKEESLKLAEVRVKEYESQFKLLSGEKIEMAYKKGRDSLIFTNMRYIHIDAFKFSSKTKFQAMPWSSILGFALETAGKFDWDSEMYLFTDMVGKPKIHMEFHKQKVNVFEIQKYLCSKVMTGTSGISSGGGKKRRGAKRGRSSEKSLVEVSEEVNASSDGIFTWLSGDGKQVDPAKYQAGLTSEESPVLEPNEVVEAAFSLRRDSLVLTNLRMINIDVKGLTGKKVEYRSIPYRAIGAYMVETAGSVFSFDMDSELEIWTTVPHPELSSFKWELRKGQADIMQVQHILSKYVLGMQNIPTSSGKSLLEASEEVDAEEEEDDQLEAEDDAIVDDEEDEEQENAAGEAVYSGKTRSGKKGQKGPKGLGKVGGFLSHFGDNAVQIDPRQAEQQLQSSTKILIDGEHVQMAFKEGRDMNVMTTHRLLFIDVQGVGSKVEYKSVPYSHVVGFAVQSAGRFDSDSELMIWTDIPPHKDVPLEPSVEDGQYVHPWGDRKCGMSYFEKDLLKGYADIYAIQQLLASKVMTPPSGYSGSSFMEFTASTGTDRSDNAEGGPFGALGAWIGGDAKSVDPAKIDAELRQNQPILLPYEKVEMPFQTGRDLTVLTSHRIIRIDVQGTGAKVEYFSVPYTSLRAYTVRSAGTFDTDAEMEFSSSFKWPKDAGEKYKCTPATPCRTFGQDKHFREGMRVKQDLRAKYVDLSEIQRFMSKKLLTPSTDSSLIESVWEGGGVLGWINGANVEQDTALAKEDLKKEINPFISGEDVKHAYKVGRDWLYFTQYRLLVKDVQGMTGAKIEYQSIPYSSVSAVSMQMAGKVLDVDCELWLETDSWSVGSVLKSFHKKKANVSEVFDLVMKEMV